MATIKSKFKRFFDKDDKYFGLFYHLIICLAFIITGVIIILTFKPFNYVYMNDYHEYIDDVDGIVQRLSAGGVYLAFGLGLLILYVVMDFFEGEGSFFLTNVLEAVGVLLIILSFVCLGYNLIRTLSYIEGTIQYIGNTGKYWRLGQAAKELTSPANQAKLIFFNPSLPLTFAVATFSYVITKDNYLGRLIAIAISIVLSYVLTLIAVLIGGELVALIFILVYAILMLVGLFGILFNVNSKAGFWFEGVLGSLFHRSSSSSSKSSGRTTSGGVSGNVKYSADAEKCVISAMNSVKGITTSTDLGYGVKVKFVPSIYVGSNTITITVNYSLSGGGSLTENQLQSVQSAFSSAAERYADEISKRAKDRYGNCNSQRYYTLHTEMGSSL